MPTNMQSLTLYNSLAGEKQVFQPITEGKINMYVCGMTVYDYCHIGHARVMVAFDVITRWMRQIGYDVNYVRNITDIDDKIINRAIENGESIHELTERFIIAMHEDEASLGCQSPNLEPKATDHIDDMQAMIATLIEKNHAYHAGEGQDVYYAVDSFDGYGKLSKRNLAEMQAGQRVDVDNNKRNPFDFVLWKAAKPEETAETHYPSPWGAGRPGWHIECSAMSTKCLGDTFDIHGGGHDLQFPHHENEIAQSEACTGHTYANNWMHVGFINVDGEKMSKSLGNFFTIRDVVAKFHPETVRYFIISSHYRSQVNFSDTALKESHSALSRLYQALKSAEAYLGRDIQLADDSTSGSVFDSEQGRAFSASMNDDFNVVSAISTLFAIAKDINIAIKSDDKDKVSELATLLKTLANPLNILQRSPEAFLQASVGEVEANGISSDEIDALIEERQQAKRDKNYARADEIRAGLLEKGIELEDSREGTTWRRK